MTESTLDGIIARGNRGHHHIDNSKIVCEDGFSVSVIAGGGTYCSPRVSFCACAHLPDDDWDDRIRLRNEQSHLYPGPYSAVEVGFPSERPEPWEDWQPYCDEPDRPTETIYSYVPVQLVRALIATHGGEKTAQALP